MCDGPPSVLFFGTFDRRRHPRVRVLMEGLAALGWQVSVLNEPWESDTADRVRALHRPWRAAPAVGQLARSWYTLWRQGRRMVAPDVVVVGYLGQLDVHLAASLFPNSVIVLDDLAPIVGTAIDRGLAGSGWDRALRTLQGAAARRADLVVVDTAEHVDDAAASVVVPVGAPEDWFGALQRPRLPGPMRVIFFGLFTPLQGTSVIARAITDVTRDVEFTVIGSGQDVAAMRQRTWNLPNVSHRRWVEPEDLPRLVAAHDVCLGIFGTTPKALRVVPNKVFQGMAAGCAVITSDTAPQRRLLAGSAILVEPGRADALGRVLNDLATAPDEVASLADRARHHAEQHFRPPAVTGPLDRRLRQEVTRR